MARVDGILVGNALVMTSTNTVYTNPANVGGMRMGSFQMRWTGAAVGTSFTVYVSNRYDNRTAIATSVANGDWIVYPTSGGLLPAGVAGGDGVTLPSIEWTWITLQYINASGTGALSVWLSAKES